MIGIRDYKPAWATADIYCDTKEELDEMQLNLYIEGQSVSVGIGSTAYCAEDRTVYILNGSKEWVEL